LYCSSDFFCLWRMITLWNVRYLAFVSFKKGWRVYISRGIVARSSDVYIPSAALSS
jgi:hypothetical protein